MKKIIPFLFALLTCTYVQAQVRISFSCATFHEKGVGHPMPKSPVQPPTVYIDDYTVLFTDNHPDYTLLIRDVDGETVYSTVADSTQAQIVLPSTLSGDYEINLVMGNWLFSGWITL